MIRRLQVRWLYALPVSIAVFVVLVLGIRSAPEPEPGALIEMWGPRHTLENQQGEVYDTWSSAIMILYSEKLDATTFRATLNGQDVTTQFHPQRSPFERVDLKEHLQIGMNELVFEAAQKLGEEKVGRLRQYNVRIERKALPSPPMIGVMPASPPPPALP